VGAPSQTTPQVAFDQLGANLVQIQWDATRYPIAVIRDRATGEILSFARGGTARVRASSRQEVQVALSDGTRTQVLE